jgi:hypothetical protein
MNIMSILAMKRTESIKFGDFMSGEYKGKQKAEKSKIGQFKNLNVKALAKGAITIPIVGHMFTKGSMAFASDGSVVVPVGEVVPVGAIAGSVTEKIIHAFDPLIELMVSLSLPIAGVMLTGGALMIMIGQKEMGFRLIMNSALGYVLVQMSPLFIDLLAGVGSAI